MATAGDTRRLPTTLRRAAYLAVTALWLSGGALLVLQLWLRRPDEFGLMRHPLEPALQTLHGVLGMAALYLLGWLSARHVGEAWRRAERRRSGIALLATLGILALSGGALFFLTGDAARAASIWLHDGLGALTPAAALAHWLARRR
jgi:hypothetical protein